MGHAGLPFHEAAFIIIKAQGGITAYLADSDIPRTGLAETNRVEYYDRMIKVFLPLMICQKGRKTQSHSEK